MKDSIHGVIVSLYYLVLKAMKKYPNQEEVASVTSQQANDTYASGVSQAGEVYLKGKEIADSALRQAQGSLASGHSQVEEIYVKGMEMASNTTQKAQDILEKGKDGAKKIVWGEEGVEKVNAT